MSDSKDKSVPESRPGCGDLRRLVKTKIPGGRYRRVDARGKTIGYIAAGEVAGRRSARTFDAARRIKREGKTDRERGEFQELTAIQFLAFLDEWVEEEQGRIQSDAAIANIVTSLHAALATAQRKGLIRRNPSSAPPCLTVREDEEVAKVFSCEHESPGQGRPEIALTESTCRGCRAGLGGVGGEHPADLIVFVQGPRSRPQPCLV